MAEYTFVRVRVRHFARVRELTGTSVELLDLPDNCNMSQLLEKLLEVHPALNVIISKSGDVTLETGYSLLINGVYSDRNSGLHDGDEVAIIPPISGG